MSPPDRRFTRAPHEVTFASGGVACAAWHLAARDDVLATGAGRPCVVMAHGFGGTRDTALLPYAEGFAAAGLDALVFDYRGFGASGGVPRQQVAVASQREDYRAAAAAARKLPGVDPRRIALWGTSYSGGHVLAVAARDPRIAAAIALTPAVDGLATLLHLATQAGPAQLVRLGGHGLRDAARALAGRGRHHVPVVGPPRTAAMMTTPGAEEACHAVAGSTWRNEVCARAALAAGFNRPARFAARVSCPLLVQVGTRDTVAPPHAAQRVAVRAPRAELLEYPVDHFDVYAGAVQRRALADQLAFLRRHLAVPTTQETLQHV